MSSVVIRYHEILLKRGNRQHFASVLRRNVKEALRDLATGALAERHGRLVLDLPDESVWPEVRERLRSTFGIANFSLSRSVPLIDAEADLRRLCEAVTAELAGRSFATFRVAARRADKRYPVRSITINETLGAAVGRATGARVDLRGADLTVTVEVVPGEMLYSVEKVEGPAGLPVGVSGRVVSLLSGGIDSPVASVRMMRRGCKITFVHFHSAPYLDRSSQEKCRDLATRLLAWQRNLRLVLVPFGDVQREIVTRVARAPRVVLYRRMMVRIASRIAGGIGARALVSGDCLGQVASQTLANLAVVEEASELPLLRPLVGMDKEEVVAEARRLGTYDISVEPDQDCCSLFVPRHPTTRARLGAIRRAEEALDVEGLVARAVTGATVESFRFPTPPAHPGPSPLRFYGGPAGKEAAS